MTSLPLVASESERSIDAAPIRVFVVTPNELVRDELCGRLTLPRWVVIHTASGAGGLELLRKHGGDDAILLLDQNLPDLESTELGGLIRSRNPETQVLMLNTQSGQILIGSSSPTPVSMLLVDELKSPGAWESDAPRRTDPGPAPNGGTRLQSMVGDSEPMHRVYRLVRMVSGRDTTVLIMGESGTGKDLVAQEIHLNSPRRKQPFIVVNCAAIPETLLEAELFGYAKGSFTGAVQSRIGRIHAAHGGTLFLDEIGDMPLALQSKILRFLEQGEVQRLGANDNLKVDVRVIAATNANLKSRLEQGEFREDLYYRLAVFPIHLPPLRDRMGDLEDLAALFVRKFSPGLGISHEAMQALGRHCWPGNVRELRNAIERATILADGWSEIQPEHICP
jgi:transcriptional regulator with GAF, ATPase, and Fis domain